ncbi:MAG: DUF1302 domain-containing protein [Proteobacteria bacterium]|nr:DUF1302 domain-containing protein [Pseudomonadota bacterium]
MKIIKHLVVLIIVLITCGYPGKASAILNDDAEGKWSLMGKWQSQATFRTEDAPDNTPVPFAAGDMTSQRNTLLLQWKHDLGRPMFDTKIEYDIKGRVFYDGSWDYGPEVMKSDSERQKYVLNNRKIVNDRDEINDEKWKAEFFQAYADLTKGPVFARIGRQVLSWGEMSTIRILDGCNPMDTSSLSVDLQERLIPLWMIRGNLAFDAVGPFTSLSVGGYYVPGKIDNTYEQKMLDGSPIMPTIGRDLETDMSDPFSMAALKQYIRMKDSDIDKDRYGIKLGMMMANGLDLNLVYYRMYSDLPVPQIDVDAIEPITVNPMMIDMHDPMGSILGTQLLNVVKTHDIVDVFGTSFNYYISAIDTVLRVEGAYYNDMPKMPPGYLSDVVDALSSKATVIGINQTIQDLINIFPLGRMGAKVLPFTSGEIPTYDVAKYGFGLDKWIKVPKISPADILVTFEYVGSTTLNYKSHQLVQPWYCPWDDNQDGHWDPVWEPRQSSTFILIFRTNYFNGNLVPQMVTMFEVEPQALVLYPSARYSWKKFDFDASLFFTVGKGYQGTLGMLQHRDELSFSITYNF